MTQRFLPLKVKEIPAEKRKEGFARECDKFCAEICLGYILLAQIFGQVDETPGRFLSFLFG
jgi:hypothetical protein